MEHDRLEALSAAVEEVRQAVVRLDDSLRGNGGRGLFTEVELMRTRVGTLEAAHAEAKALKRWVTLGVLSVVGTLAWNIAQAYLSV